MIDYKNGDIFIVDHIFTTNISYLSGKEEIELLVT